jgi:hypothetical protein
MQVLMMVYDVAFDEEVMEALSRCHLSGYTKWSRVVGSGERSQPRLGTAVWPGHNCAVLMAVENGALPELTLVLQGLYRRMGEKSLAVFGWTAERMI